MNTTDLKELSTDKLLDLYESFVKMWHYEAVNEFDSLRKIGVDYYEVRREIERRMKGSE